VDHRGGSREHRREGIDCVVRAILSLPHRSERGQRLAPRPLLGLDRRQRRRRLLDLAELQLHRDPEATNLDRERVLGDHGWLHLLRRTETGDGGGGPPAPGGEHPARQVQQ
jgi:hypothetical protein